MLFRSALAACCGPLIDGWAHAASPEALMRSRYTAYATGTPDAIAYLVATHHHSTREPDLAEGIAASVAAIDAWEGLRVVHAASEGDTGVVEFVASFRRGGERGELRERSRFAREDGRWSYVDGEIG